MASDRRSETPEFVMFCHFCGSLLSPYQTWLVCARCGRARLLFPPEAALSQPARNWPGRITPSETPVMIRPTQMMMAADATGMSLNAA